MDNPIDMSKQPHMSSEDFRRHGYAMIDWIVEYFERIEQLPVLSQVKPGDIRRQLPPHPPTKSEPFENCMQDLEKIILPGITHWQSPNFFAYFPANTSFPSILGELLSAGLGVQGMLWATSPAATELETHVLDWLADMLGLPEQFKSSSPGGGVIQDTASSATLCAILAARDKATNFAATTNGISQKMVAYSSNQAHSSIDKAMMIAGVGRENLRSIQVDENFAMQVEELEKQILKDKEAGFLPFFIQASLGTTSSGAVDPIKAIGQIAKKYNLWFHVDAAMSGTAGLCPEFRYMQEGLELADSYSFNPHKWMFTNFDCNCFYVSDRKTLVRTLSILPEYLKNEATESGAVIDYRDWHIQLGRRFRSLKLWFVIRHYGVEGLQHLIRQHVNLAQEFANWIKANENFELAAPVPLNLVCFRQVGGDIANQKLLEKLNSSGKVYLSHTRLDGKYTLRLCVGQTNTERRHVEQVWKLILQNSKAV